MDAYELPSYVVRVKGSWEKIKQVEKKNKSIVRKTTRCANLYPNHQLLMHTGGYCQMGCRVFKPRIQNYNPLLI